MQSINQTILTGDQAITTEPFTELNVKLGAQWYINESIDIASGTTTRILFDLSIGDNKRMIMKFFEVDAKDEITFKLFKNVDWTASVAGGDQIDVKNFSDLTEQATGVTVNYNPTVITTPTEQQRVYSHTTPDSTKHAKVSGLIREIGIEYLFQDNQKLAFEFINDGNSSVQVDFNCTWYEGRLSTDVRELTGSGF